MVMFLLIGFLGTKVDDGAWSVRCSCSGDSSPYQVQGWDAVDTALFLCSVIKFHCRQRTFYNVFPADRFLKELRAQGKQGGASKAGEQRESKPGKEKGSEPGRAEEVRT